MATTYEIIQGIHQAAANAYDGALDDKGEPVKLGLSREEGNPITDSRVMDGFKIKILADKLSILYQSDINMKDAHEKGFETEIAQTINDVASFLKREYKKLVGDNITLTKQGEPDILVQNVSNVRVFVQAMGTYKIGGLSDVDPLDTGSEDRVDDAIKNFLAIGKDKYPGAKKPKNVTI